MPLTTLSLEDLYAEISDLARDQGVASREAWDEMVDDVVEDHLDLGELDLDQDTEGMKDVLRTRWQNYKEESLSSDEVDRVEEDVEMKEEREENDKEDELTTTFYDKDEAVI